MSRQSEILTMAINTAQPTDVLTAQPKHGRVLTETVQPQGSPDAKVPQLISGVAPGPNQVVVQIASPVPASEPGKPGSK